MSSFSQSQKKAAKRCKNMEKIRIWSFGGWGIINKIYSYFFFLFNRMMYDKDDGRTIDR